MEAPIFILKQQLHKGSPLTVLAIGELKPEGSHDSRRIMVNSWLLRTTGSTICSFFTYAKQMIDGACALGIRPFFHEPKQAPKEEQSSKHIL